ncbi:hypothetical protein F4604DRAFT_1676444 [Suillus subluteus]|nr:hypothetical protein F4604DRAFT_1676444 [Suillus subluteus]
MGVQRYGANDDAVASASSKATIDAQRGTRTKSTEVLTILRCVIEAASDDDNRKLGHFGWLQANSLPVGFNFAGGQLKFDHNVLQPFLCVTFATPFVQCLAITASSVNSYCPRSGFPVKDW